VSHAVFSPSSFTEATRPVVSSGRTIDELERIWKETISSHIQILSRNVMGRSVRNTAESGHRRLVITCFHKIGDFQGGDYEECRLLGYEDPLHTSQETHYVSPTEPSQLMLCKI
jgi:hypothetical protein